LELVQPANPNVTIAARGLRKDASILSPKNVQVEIDVAMAKRGRRRFSVSREQVVLPNDRIDLVRIEPNEYVFDFQQKQQEPEGK
jgi:hypothetical protein